MVGCLDMFCTSCNYVYAKPCNIALLNLNTEDTRLRVLEKRKNPWQLSMTHENLNQLNETRQGRKKRTVKQRKGDYSYSLKRIKTLQTENLEVIDTIV